MIVYKHTSNTSKKSYIGVTKKTINKRWEEHINKSKKSNNVHFYNAIRKYGVEDFTSIILEDNISCSKTLYLREIFWINYYDTFNNGYNMTNGGSGGATRTGVSNTPEHNAKIRKFYVDNPDKWSGVNHPQYGTSKPEHSNNMKGEGNPRFGKEVTKETRDKISEANKGKQGWGKGKRRKVVHCPYCAKSGGNGVMQRWHFDNCKEKDK